MPSDDPEPVAFDRHQGGKPQSFLFFHSSKNEAVKGELEKELKKHPHEQAGGNLYFVFTDLSGAELFMQLGVVVPPEEEAYLVQLSRPFRVWPQPDKMESIALRLPAFLEAVRGVVSKDQEY